MFYDVCMIVFGMCSRPTNHEPVYGIRHIGERINRGCASAVLRDCNMIELVHAKLTHTYAATRRPSGMHVGRASEAEVCQTPLAGTGDSVGRFCCYRCSTLFNYTCDLSLCDTFLQRSWLLPFTDNCGLLPTPKETYDLNLSAVTFRILSFRIPTLILCTKELYSPALFASPREWCALS